MTDSAFNGRGQFGGAGLAGERTFDAAELIDDTPYLGLEREASYCWGSARNRNGDLFVYMRRITAHGGSKGAERRDHGDQLAMSDRFILVSNTDDADNLRIGREGRFSAETDHLTQSLEDGRAAFRVPATGARGEMELIAGDDTVSYREAHLLDLSGARLRPAVHWYLPYGPSALYYTSQVWAVAGEILGNEVEGFVWFEEAYMPPGGRLYVTHSPLEPAKHRIWKSWVTTWDDGTTEWGHFVVGDGPLSIGIIVNADGSVRVAKDIKVEIERDPENYWYERIALDVDGEPWEIVADPKGRMVDLGPIPNPQQEGIARRVGETRTPVTWEANGENYPQHDPG
jgi:hypothetical protein